jgi:hypothetical protein
VLSKDSIHQILNAGGHVRISTLAKDSLVELANVARLRKARLEIKGNVSLDTAMAVVNAGGGFVLIDLTDE